MIPVSKPTIGERELEYVTECLKTGWISSSGRFVKEFEDGFSSYCGARQGISTTSGTTALQLALASLKIGKGDEVIVPSFTMIATIAAVVHAGAKPVFVDSEPETWNIDPAKIEDIVTSRTKAIMPVHLFGHPCDMDPIMKTAEKHGLRVIEDAAEAHGAEYRGKRVGSVGDVGCFSFYANKIVTTGEGGMLVTNNEAVAERARSLKNLMFDKERTFIHSEAGFNYRMTNIQAAIGLAQFERIEETIEAKRRNARLYNSLLADVQGITAPKEMSWAKNVYWMYAVLVEDGFGASRDNLRKGLESRGIETRLLFAPAHMQPFLSDPGLSAKDYPVAEMLYKKGLYLPSAASLTRDEIEEVCNAIKDIQKSS